MIQSGGSGRPVMQDWVLRTKLGLSVYCDTYMPIRLIVG